jgi:tRNA-dihydrouridine synthase B
MMLAHHGPVTGVRLARKHVAWYSKGLPGSAEFRAAVNQVSDPAAVEALVHRFYDPLVARGVTRTLVRETSGEGEPERAQPGRLAA